MQVKYLWPKCSLGFINDEISWRCNTRNAFWILASENEAKNLIVPLISNLEHWVECIPPENLPRCDYDIYSRDINGNVGFLVTDDVSRVIFMEPIYPVSSMWGIDNPFKKFERKISSLYDLRNLL